MALICLAACVRGVTFGLANPENQKAAGPTPKQVSVATDGSTRPHNPFPAGYSSNVVSDRKVLVYNYAKGVTSLVIGIHGW